MPQANYPYADYFAQRIQNMHNLVDGLTSQGRGLPVVCAAELAILGTSSSSYVSLSGSPTVTPMLGASGDALIYAAGFVGINDAGNTAQATVTIDGVLTPVSLTINVSGVAAVAPIEATLSTISQLSALGMSVSNNQAHTFGFLYRSGVSGDSVDFNNMFIGVQPL